MNRVAFALSVIAVVATAAWSYHVNYRTRGALAEVAALEAEIAAERERLQVLAVEWAHLNAPERLARLVAEQAAALALVPMTPEHFGAAEAVPFPPRRTPLAAGGTPVARAPALPLAEAVAGLSASDLATDRSSR